MKEYADEQTEWNMHEGLSIQLHGYILKKLGLDLDSINTDLSNELLEICDDVIDLLYSQLDVRVEEEIEPKLSKKRNNRKNNETKNIL